MLSQGYIKGLRRCWRNGASGLLMPLCECGWGDQRIMNKGGRVKNRTAIKGELRRLEKGDMN